jgi:hypothetical protein
LTRFRGLPLLSTRGIIVDYDLVRDENITQSDYYQDFLRRFDLRWFAGLKIQVPDELWCLSIQRTIAAGPFTTAEQSMLGPTAVRSCHIRASLPMVLAT